MRMDRPEGITWPRRAAPGPDPSGGACLWAVPPFVRDPESPGERIARKLGLQTMAEGVETQAQFEALRELGCDSFQGYLFGQPMPAGALAGLL